MLFADDLVICEEPRLEVEQQLDRWREVLEENGLRISRKKTEYLRPAGSSEEVCLAGVPIPCINSFKYYGSTIEATGGCGADVDNILRSAWNSWRGLSGGKLRSGGPGEAEEQTVQNCHQTIDIK